MYALLMLLSHAQIYHKHFVLAKHQNQFLYTYYYFQ